MKTQLIFNHDQKLYWYDKYKNNREYIDKTKFIEGEPNIIIIGKINNK